MSRGQARTHVLYRMFDAAGELLYVGITNNPVSRFRDHRLTKSWWGTVSSIGVTHFATRQELLAAEREAIANEKPRYNGPRVRVFSAAWCAEQGHGAPARKRCAACRVSDAEVRTELEDDFPDDDGRWVLVEYEASAPWTDQMVAADDAAAQRLSQMLQRHRVAS